MAALTGYGTLWHVTTPPADLSPRSHRRWIAFILLLALALRIGWVLSRPADDASLAGLPDQSEYLDLGRNLLESRGLFFYDARFRSTVYAYRMPLYPAMIAACGGSIRATLVLQAVLDTSSVLAAACLAAGLLPRQCRRRGTLWASAVVAANPFLLYFCGLILSETLFTTLLLWGMVCLLAGSQGGHLVPTSDAGDLRPYRPRAGTLLWLFGGLLLALSTLVRPSAAPLAVIMGIAASFAVRPLPREVRAAFRPRWPLPVATTMLLLTVATLFPWAYRNQQVLGTWVWTTTNGGVTAYDGFNRDATGASDQSVLRDLPQLSAMNEVERSTYLSSRATQFIRDQPLRALELAAIKAGRTWSPIPLSADYGSWTYRLIGMSYSVPLDLLALVGLFAAPIRRSAKAFLFAPVVYFTLVHMASVGSLRYRVPVEPLLAVLAAAGIAAISLRRFGWRRAGENDSEPG
ncbi:hypothetical protein [Humisphaera borealis]|uniref:Glycosyltransferase RgtA/B/C/D-like domain-containing protein n=1 Tax=Humisphaera borealis TaxID=2807512 RepID=A0A7M2X1F6_9BACT|nr:hypothetical protein [Humisphaera borealis]QOV91576.1 hypothetical protein IPV69_09535 [Humisphaera borealis]